MDLTGANWPNAGLSKSFVPRSSVDVDSVMPQAKEIIAAVKGGTSDTVLALTEKFDGIKPPSLRVPNEIIEAAVASASPEFVAALKTAAARVRFARSTL